MGNFIQITILLIALLTYKIYLNSFYSTSTSLKMYFKLQYPDQKQWNINTLTVQ